MKRREFLALLAVGPLAGPVAGTEIACSHSGADDLMRLANPFVSINRGALGAIREWLEGSGVRCDWSRDPIMGPNDSHTCYIVKGWGLDRIVLESCDRQPLHGELTRIIMRWLERGDWHCAVLRVRTCERTGVPLPKLEKLVFEGRFPS